MWTWKPHPGDRVRPAESNLDLLGYVVAVGDTTGDAVRRAEAALGQLTPVIDTAIKGER
ncbi:hypothetical protein ABT115_24790 [Streptomyces sp. NPDC001832]|uniref:hypothetical protein n=1 Tax=Streptomyces sp. NPDC001832 TaxID=3154527 RepID=UPI003333CC30